MSLTLKTLAARVQQMTRDTDPDRRVVSSPRTFRLLVDKGWAVALDLGVPETWTTAFVTLSDTGSSDFSAPGSVFGRIRRLRLASTGAEVRRASPAEVEAMRAAVPLPAGSPQFFYVYESGPTTMKLRFHPRPNAADTVDAMVSALPTDTALSSDTMDLVPHVMDAIVKLVAADIVRSLDEASLARLQLDRGAADAFEREGAGLIEREKLRLARARRVGYVSTTWVR